MSRLKLFLIEDEPAIAQPLYDVLAEEGYDVSLATDGAAAMAKLNSEVFDVVISDIRLPFVDGLTIFSHLRQSSPRTHVVLMSAYGTIAEAVRVMKEKAAHYLAKPFNLDELVGIVENIAKERELLQRLEVAGAVALEADDDLIIGNSPGVVLIKNSIKLIAKSKASVLIVGESGSGKELIAQSIHMKSPRAQAPFVAVNCAALPDTLLEAELFGHEAGAFTGAVKKRQGRFSAANGGTLFLDEIGDMSPAAQAKLLRAIETGTYEPLGSDATESVDVRIISATNVDLASRVEEGKFRADLYYRLKVFQLRLPPLRERRADLALLVRHFYERAGGEPGPRSEPCTARAFDALDQYRFPGNVRELKHAIEHAVVLAQGAPIDIEHLPEEIQAPTQPRRRPDAPTSSLPDAMREFERDYLLRTLAAANGQRSRAAELLGISRKTLWLKLRQYGISDEDIESEG